MCFSWFSVHHQKYITLFYFILFLFLGWDKISSHGSKLLTNLVMTANFGRFESTFCLVMFQVGKLLHEPHHILSKKKNHE
jgi:hypothetical protein